MAKKLFERNNALQNDLQKTIQIELRKQKIIKRKRDKQYAHWKGYDNLFNILIDKKGFVL